MLTEQSRVLLTKKGFSFLFALEKEQYYADRAVPDYLLESDIFFCFGETEACNIVG